MHKNKLAKSSKYAPITTKEKESYRGMFKNLSQVSHVLGVMCQKFNEAHISILGHHYLAT